MTDRTDLADDFMDRAEAILSGVLNLPPAEQADALERACDDHPDLGQVLREGYAALADLSLVEQPVATRPTGGVARGRIPEIPGIRIEAEIGSGGMGVVYRAEQVEPVKRRVAVKLIRSGMHTERILGRFEAERQALARMSHPCIAQVYGAGTTGEGEPYFLMEFVEGTPIDRYCDDRGLSVDARLALFQRVCEGVQHAHQKGIIHRDLKPTNILVVEHEGVPMPKIIDFGIAKATEEKLLDRTLHTEQGAVIGTPEYMSPEQAAGDSADLDTRTDVYSLGVVLYGLLTGVLPFATMKLRRLGLQEVVRVLQDEVPQKPSSRVGTAEGGTRETATRRRHTPSGLSRQLRGDLDWITMKALEKDRDRRYASATELAGDVQRFREQQPVLAGPPSRVYRLRRFVRRNRLVVSAVAAVLVTLLGGVVAFYVQYQEARTQERLAKVREGEAQRREAEAVRQKARGDRRFTQVHELIDVLIYDFNRELRKVDGTAGLRRMLADTATKYLSVLAEEASELRVLRRSMASTYLNVGVAHPDPEDGVRCCREAERLFRELCDESPGDPRLNGKLADAIEKVGLNLVELTRISEGVAEIKRSVAVRTAWFDEHVPGGPTGQQLRDLCRGLSVYGHVLALAARREEAEEVLGKCQDGLERLAKGRDMTEQGDVLEMLVQVCATRAVVLKHLDVERARAMLRLAEARLKELRVRDPGVAVAASEARVSQARIVIGGASSQPDPAARFAADRRAASRIRGLLAKDPTNNDLATQLATLTVRLADYCLSVGQVGAYGRWLEAGLAAIGAANPRRDMELHSVAHSSRLAVRHLIESKPDEATAVAARAVQHAESFAANYPGEVSSRGRLDALVSQGRALVEAERFEAARKVLRTVLDEAAVPPEDASLKATYRLLEADANLLLSRSWNEPAWNRGRDHNHAYRFTRRAEELVRELSDEALALAKEGEIGVSRVPELVGWRSARQLARLQLEMGDFEDARRTLEPLERRVRVWASTERPYGWWGRLELGRVLIELGLLHERSGKLDEAREVVLRAMAELERVAEMDGGPASAAYWLGVARTIACRTSLAASQDSAVALRHGEAAVRVLEPFFRAGPRLARRRMHMFDALRERSRAGGAQGTDAERIERFVALAAHMEREMDGESVGFEELLQFARAFAELPVLPDRPLSVNEGKALACVEKARGQCSAAMEETMVWLTHRAVLERYERFEAGLALIDRVLERIETSFDGALQPRIRRIWSAYRIEMQNRLEAQQAAAGKKD